MRSARLTYQSAWHHVMNRGYEGRVLFPNEKHKAAFISFLGSAAGLYQIRLAGYCLMSNHYHLVLQNSSGKLSEFMKYLNSGWAVKYRASQGGKGYVFQGRFKSTIIEEDRYLAAVLCYVLMNPVRAGLVDSPWDYGYSSIRAYHRNPDGIVDADLVRGIFPNVKALDDAMGRWKSDEIKPRTTRIGLVLGCPAFIESTIKRFNRRKTTRTGSRKRILEDEYPAPDRLIREFELKKGIRLDSMNFKSLREKRLRADLTVELKERGGLTYPQIIRLPCFRGMKMASLSNICRNARKRGQS